MVESVVHTVAKEAIRTGFSPFIEKPHSRQPFIPPQHPTRKFFSDQPVAFVNCGFSTIDAGSTSNVSYEPTNAAVYSLPAASIQNYMAADGNPNPTISDFSTSFRYTSGNLSYTVNVPSEGRYDVTLVFNAIHPFFLGVGKCILSVEVSGEEKHMASEVDVFAEVGGYRTYVLSFSSVLVKDVLKISLYKGYGSSYTFLNGFVVLPSSDEHGDTLVSEDVVAIHDCGNDLRQYLPPNVQVHSNYAATSLKSVKQSRVISDSFLSSALAKSSAHVGANRDFGYDIAVPKPGRYDVSVCFSELHIFQKDYRLINLYVTGLDVFTKRNLDVFSEVGPFTPYIATCQNMRVDDKVEVRVLGMKREAIINGITVSKATPFPATLLEDSTFVTTVDCGNGGVKPEMDSGMEPNIIYEGAPSRGYPPAREMCILGEDQLFRDMGRSCRTSATELVYKFTSRSKDVTTYDVAMVFCEVEPTAFGVGKRVFSVEMQAASLWEVKDMDVYNTVGAYRVRVEFFKEVELVDGGLTIKIKKTGGTLHAMISGILIAPHGTNELMKTPPPPVAFVSCTPFGAIGAPFGGVCQDVTVEVKGVARAASKCSCGGSFLRSICAGSIYGAYKFKVNIIYPGEYNVYLFMADRMKSKVGDRVFTVQVTGIEMQEVTDLDVVAEVGKNRAFVLQFLNVSVDSTITIEGIPKTYVPTLSGFAIYEAGFEPMNVAPRPSFTANKILGRCDRECDKPTLAAEQTKKTM